MSYVVTSLVSRERTRRRGFNRVFDPVAMATYRDAALSQGDVTLWLRDNATGLLTNEVQNGATLARSYDFLGRPTGYTLCATASLREISCSYDSLGRLSTVASGTNVFTYSYLLGTDLVSGYTCCGFSRTVAYEPYRDLVSAITNRFGSRVISTFEYTNDAAGRRTAIKRSGEAMGPLSGATDAYGYNGRNEVVSARRTLGGSPVAGFNEDFAYDPIGNRVSATDYDETGAARTSTYAANNLNQYTSRTVPGWASVRGLADADATVAVNGNPAFMVGRADPSAPNPDDLAYFFGSDDFDNSAGGGFADLEVSAVVSDGTNDLVSVATNRVFVPPANETYAYDADGNLTLVTTGTGAWQVEYNGENRPVRWTCGDRTLLMDYDHMGRRRSYVEQKGNVVGKRHVFTYDGYLQIARSRVVDADFGAGDDAFLWDPTEPVATRPLACSLSTPQSLNASTFFYALDGNKNVTELIGERGEIAVHYEYSAFGKTLLSLSADGHTDSLNPWRFSSEYSDDATRLVYYNYRHYEPVMGRWTTKDLVDYVLGYSPYRMLMNCVLYENDILGLRRYRNNHRGRKSKKGLPRGQRIRDGVLECRTLDPKPGYKPSYNGCGSGWTKYLVPDQDYLAILAWEKVDFTPACNNHDICYGTCGEDKSKCNQKLEQDMKNVCDGVKDSVVRRRCNSIAELYRYALDKNFLSEGPYQDAQDEACDWRPCCEIGADED